MVFPPNNKLLNVQEACAKLGVGKTSLYVLVTEKKISVVKIGSRTLFAESELDRFIGELLATAA
jgi:excisionase family DNA binding protein